MAILNNHELCGTYPAQIIVPLRTRSTDIQESRMKVRNSSHEGSPLSPTDGTYIEKLVGLSRKAALARIRGRYVAPIILYKNNYVCRSATISQLEAIPSILRQSPRTEKMGSEGMRSPSQIAMQLLRRVGRRLRGRHRAIKTPWGCMYCGLDAGEQKSKVGVINTKMLVFTPGQSGGICKHFREGIPNVLAVWI